MSRRYLNLNPDKALIWRIVHRDNLPWILDNGLHCGNGSARSPGWVSIGNPELIDKRACHPVVIRNKQNKKDQKKRICFVYRKAISN